MTFSFEWKFLNSRLKNVGLQVHKARLTGILSFKTRDRIILNILTKITEGFVVYEKLTK